MRVTVTRSELERLEDRSIGFTELLSHWDLPMMHEGSVITDVAAGPGESVCVLVGAETINLRY